jgi:hypothetical protein
MGAGSAMSSVILCQRIFRCGPFNKSFKISLMPPAILKKIQCDSPVYFHSHVETLESVILREGALERYPELSKPIRYSNNTVHLLSRVL